VAYRFASAASSFASGAHSGAFPPIDLVFIGAGLVAVVGIAIVAMREIYAVRSPTPVWAAARAGCRRTRRPLTSWAVSRCERRWLIGRGRVRRRCGALHHAAALRRATSTVDRTIAQSGRAPTEPVTLLAKEGK
jgi:hypothetical protein